MAPRKTETMTQKTNLLSKTTGSDAALTAGASQTVARMIAGQGADGLTVQHGAPAYDPETKTLTLPTGDDETAIEGTDAATMLRGCRNQFAFRERFELSEPVEADDFIGQTVADIHAGQSGWVEWPGAKRAGQFVIQRHADEAFNGMPALTADAGQMAAAVTRAIASGAMTAADVRQTDVANRPDGSAIIEVAEAVAGGTDWLDPDAASEALTTLRRFSDDPTQMPPDGPPADDGDDGDEGDDESPQGDGGQGEGEPSNESDESDEGESDSEDSDGGNSGDGDGESGDESEGEGEGEIEPDESGSEGDGSEGDGSDGDEGQGNAEGDGEGDTGDSQGQPQGEGEGESDGESEGQPETGNQPGGGLEDGAPEGMPEGPRPEPMKRAEDEGLEDLVSDMGGPDEHGYSRNRFPVYSGDPETIKWLPVDLPTRSKTAQTWQGHYWRKDAKVEPDAASLGRKVGTVLSRVFVSRAPRHRRKLERGFVDRRRMAQMMTGTSDFVMRRRLPTETIDTAVMLAVDASGSMERHSRPMVTALHAMNIALEQVGIPFAVTFWDGRGNWRGAQSPFLRFEDLRLKIAKDFDDPATSQRVKKNINAYGYNVWGGTPIGEAVEQTLNQLAVRPESRRILMVFTDGAPALSRGGYKVQHLEFLERQFRRAEAMNIEPVLMGFGPHAADAYPGRVIDIGTDLAMGMTTHLERYFSK